MKRNETTTSDPCRRSNDNSLHNEMKRNETTTSDPCRRSNDNILHNENMCILAIISYTILYYNIGCRLSPTYERVCSRVSYNLQRDMDSFIISSIHSGVSLIWCQCCSPSLVPSILAQHWLLIFTFPNSEISTLVWDIIISDIICFTHSRFFFAELPCSFRKERKKKKVVSLGWAYISARLDRSRILPSILRIRICQMDSVIPSSALSTLYRSRYLLAARGRTEYLDPCRAKMWKAQNLR
jgi:hypothetical protein